MRFAIVGCGDISRRYASAIVAAPTLELVGVTDVSAERATAVAAEYGVQHYPSIEAALADDGIDAVVNLTAPQAHAAVSSTALAAGRHVHTEKPVALRYSEARELVDLAARNGVRLSCAPATLLGEAQQTLWKLVREGAIGDVRIAYAEANWNRIESWHPSPEGLLGVGPLVDVGVYPLTILTAMFGPARSVRAYGTTVLRERVRKDGISFTLDAPDFVVAVVELNGVVVRATASFYAGTGSQRGIELHGDDGRLWLAAFAEANSRLQRSTPGGDYEPVPLVREPFEGIDWGRALVDLDEAVREGRSHRASGEQAAHVVEVLEAVERSIENGAAVEIASTFEPPAPMEWAA